MLFCAAPLGLIGAVADGLSGYFYLLAVKAVMDGLATLGSVKTLGWPAALSAFPVFLFLGVITLAVPALRRAVPGIAQPGRRRFGQFRQRRRGVGVLRRGPGDFSGSQGRTGELFAGPGGRAVAGVAVRSLNHAAFAQHRFHRPVHQRIRQRPGDFVERGNGGL